MRFGQRLLRSFCEDNDREEMQGGLVVIVKEEREESEDVLGVSVTGGFRVTWFPVRTAVRTYLPQFLAPSPRAFFAVVQAVFFEGRRPPVQ
jgi:hypothetical protein